MRAPAAAHMAHACSHNRFYPIRTWEHCVTMASPFMCASWE